MTDRPEIRTDARTLASGDGEAEPPQTGAMLFTDVVYDDAGLDSGNTATWAPFGDAEAAVMAAAAAVAEWPALVGIPSSAVIALSSDDDVATLNATYRGQAKPTNVLSFPASSAARPPDGDEPRPLGDIIIARETVLREAHDQGIPPIHHLQHLVVHGLLHLLGHDHIHDSDAVAMEALETAILAGLGIPDPYRDGDLDAGPAAAAGET